MSSQPDVSVVLVNWNTRTLLQDCLGSIPAAAGALNIETIVVDNASTDGSVSMLNQCFPHVLLIENADNVGFARANNQAIRRASGRYVLLLNSDTIARLRAIETLVRFADAFPGAGIVGCKLLNKDGSLQHSWASFPSLRSELLGSNMRSRKKLKHAPQDCAAYSVDWVGGAALLARSDMLKQTGLLDEAIFMYSEETDLCYRAKRQGWQVCYLEDAEIIHLGGGSSGRASLNQLRRLYDSKIYFFHKHYGALAAILLRLGLAAANTFGLLRRTMAVALRQTTRQDALVRIRMQWALVGHLLRP